MKDLTFEPSLILVGCFHVKSMLPNCPFLVTDKTGDVRICEYLIYKLHFYIWISLMLIHISHLQIVFRTELHRPYVTMRMLEIKIWNTGIMHWPGLNERQMHWWWLNLFCSFLIFRFLSFCSSISFRSCIILYNYRVFFVAPWFFVAPSFWIVSLFFIACVKCSSEKITRPNKQFF